MNPLPDPNLQSRDRLRSNIENEWRHVVSQCGLESAFLLQVSPIDLGRRIYRIEDKVYKIRLVELDETASLRQNNYAQEYEILKFCRGNGLEFIPRPIGHRKTQVYEILELEYFDGVALPEFEGRTFPLILWKLLTAVVRLSRAGISHNDLRSANVLVGNVRSIAVVDFDQACHSDFLPSLMANLLGLSLQRRENKVHGSYMTVVKDRVKRVLPRKLLIQIRRWKGHGDAFTPIDIPENANARLKLMREAWKLGQLSDANAPGAFVAYYSLTEDGCFFPGERPWHPRWDSLSTITDYDSKIILELGCNMGLLSSFLMKERNAAAAFGTDIDSKILEAARLVAKAYDVEPSFTRMDFDSAERWEDTLRATKPDVVFALNVLNWVHDKGRLLRFLGEHKEVIFEGHDSTEIETARLKGVGFNHVRLVAVSERGRPLLHCLK